MEEKRSVIYRFVYNSQKFNKEKKNKNFAQAHKLTNKQIKFILFKLGVISVFLIKKIFQESVLIAAAKLLRIEFHRKDCFRYQANLNHLILKADKILMWWSFKHSI